MPSDLTDGYTLAAQIPVSILHKVFSDTFTQLMPGLEKTLTDGRKITIWFQEHKTDIGYMGDITLKLLPQPFLLVNPIEIGLPFKARLSGEYDELYGRITIRTELTTLRIGSFLSPAIDFHPENVNSFEVTGWGEADAWPHRPLTPETHAIWAPAITEALKPALADVSPVTAGLVFPEIDTQFLVNSYPDVTFGSPSNRVTGLLCVFIWAPGTTPPPVPSSVTPRNIYRYTAMALVPRDRVEQAIDEGLEASGLKNLPVDVGGADLTSIAIEWRDFGQGDGHFYMHGNVEADIGGAGIEAWVKLHIIEGQTKVDVIQTKIDGDLLFDIADFVTAGLVSRTLDEVLPRAVGNIGTGAFGELGVFASGAVPEPQAFASADISGNIYIWPGGLGIPASLSATTEVTSSFPPPRYFRGHSRSREFHLPSCDYARFAAVRIPSRERAIELGYNGCWHCQRDYNVASWGTLQVLVAPTTVWPPAKVTGRLASDVERFGVTVRPGIQDFSLNRFYSPVPGYRYYSGSPLVRGTWEVTITQGDWTAITTVESGKAWPDADGKVHGTYTRVMAEVGSQVVTSDTFAIEE
jgi:hypothetical protein